MENKKYILQDIPTVIIPVEVEGPFGEPVIKMQTFFINPLKAEYEERRHFESMMEMAKLADKLCQIRYEDEQSKKNDEQSEKNDEV